MIMFCNQCGKHLPEDAKFCHHCGSAVGVENVENIEIHKPQAANSESVPVVKTARREKKLKLAASSSKKKRILTAIAAIVILVVIILGITVVKNHQPVLAELPDPEYYFSAVGIDEIREKNDVKTVILRSQEDIWNLAAGYVNLLKWSGIYPVYQTDEEQYSSGDYTWNFCYNNREDIKQYYYCQVKVDYYCNTNGREGYAVWITLHDTDAFDLVEREQYTESDARAEFSGMENSDTAESTSNDSDIIVQTPIVDESSDNSDVVFEDEFADEDDDFGVYDAGDIYDNPTPCGVCDGDGDCNTCGGDGYLHSSASDEEDRNCYSCSGRGTCRSCGGDGEL